MSNSMFPVPTNTNLETIQEEGSLKAVIDGEKIMLMDMPLELIIIQQGMLANKEDEQVLMPHVGKIAYAIRVGGARAWLGKFEKTLRLIPMEEGRVSRTLFAPYQGAGGDNRLLCSSPNNRFPSKRIEEPFATRCTEPKLNDQGYWEDVPLCKKAEWKGRIAPECKENREVSFFDLDRKCNVVMRLKSTAIQAWNELRNKKYKSAVTQAKFNGESIANFYIELTAHNNGRYVVPMFSIKNAEEPLAHKYAPLISYYLMAFKQKPEVPVTDENIGAELDAAGFGVPTPEDRMNVTVDLDMEYQPTPEELNAVMKENEEAFSI